MIWWTLLSTTPFVASLSPEAERATDVRSHFDGGQIGSIWSYWVFFVFDHCLAEGLVRSCLPCVSWHLPPSSSTIHNPNKRKMKTASQSVSRKQETTSVSMLKFAVISVWGYIWGIVIISNISYRRSLVIACGSILLSFGIKSCRTAFWIFHCPWAGAISTGRRRCNMGVMLPLGLIDGVDERVRECWHNEGGERWM